MATEPVPTVTPYPGPEAPRIVTDLVGSARPTTADAGQVPAAVLFDMDGTLIDSERLWDIAVYELAERYGGRLSAAARQAMIGSAMLPSMRVLHDDLGQPWRDPAEGIAWLERRVAELFATGLPWRPGARALLSAVRAAGIPTALVTSSSRALVEIALRSLGRENFTVVVCGDEVDDNKPHPAPYLTAARLLGVPIEWCVAIEDSPTGVASARAAGAAVLAVPSERAVVEAADGVHLRPALTGVDLAMLAGLCPVSGDTAVDRGGIRAVPLSDQAGPDCTPR